MPSQLTAPMTRGSGRSPAIFVRSLICPVFPKSACRGNLSYICVMEKPQEKTDKAGAKGPRKRQPPRKMTRERVFNIARFHVERFSTTTGNLRAVLMRRADRALRVHGGDRAE